LLLTVSVLILFVFSLSDLLLDLSFFDAVFCIIFTSEKMPPLVIITKNCYTDRS